MRSLGEKRADKAFSLLKEHLGIDVDKYGLDSSESRYSDEVIEHYRISGGCYKTKHHILLVVNRKKNGLLAAKELYRYYRRMGWKLVRRLSREQCKQFFYEYANEAWLNDIRDEYGGRIPQWYEEKMLCWIGDRYFDGHATSFWGFTPKTYEQDEWAEAVREKYDR